MRNTGQRGWTGKTAAARRPSLAAPRNPWDRARDRTIHGQQTDGGEEDSRQTGKKTAVRRQKAVPDVHGSGDHPKDQVGGRVARQDGIPGTGRSRKGVARATSGRKEVRVGTPDGVHWLRSPMMYQRISTVQELRELDVRVIDAALSDRTSGGSFGLAGECGGADLRAHANANHLCRPAAWYCLAAAALTSCGQCHHKLAFTHVFFGLD